MLRLGSDAHQKGKNMKRMKTKVYKAKVAEILRAAGFKVSSSAPPITVANLHREWKGLPPFLITDWSDKGAAKREAAEYLYHVATFEPAKAPKKAKIVARPEIPAGFYATKVWQKLRYRTLIHYGRRCMCCGATAKDGVKIHVDHIKPRSRYPELALEFANLQVLCEPCNMGKGADDETDFRPPLREVKKGSILR